MLVGQVGENGHINVVLGEPLRVLGHAELFEPVGDLLHCEPLRTKRHPLWTGRIRSLPQAPTYCSAHSGVACPIRVSSGGLTQRELCRVFAKIADIAPSIARFGSR